MFSKQVIADISTMFPNTHAAIDSCLFRYDLDDKVEFEQGDSISVKLGKISKYLYYNQDVRDSRGENIVYNVVQDRLRNSVLDNFNGGFDRRTNQFEYYPNLYRNLLLDGYDVDFTNHSLVRILPENIDAHKKEDYIISILGRRNFTTTKNHLEQAKASFSSGNYAALTGQLRTYTESLFIEIAQHIKNVEDLNNDIATITPSNATTAMQILVKANHPIIDISLNEWTGDNKGYIQAFWKRLHPEGSHPGIPSLEEAVYRFQLVLLNTYNLLRRFNDNY